MNLSGLAKPFPVERISWRVGSTTADKSRGLALAYIDARDVMERLDEVCGIGGWQCSYPHANGKTVCAIGIKVGDEWVWKSDGAGDTDVEAEKGALSDAFKRAAVRWGIGRYIYDIPSPWVALKQAGRSYAIADGEYKALEALLTRKSPTQTQPEASAVDKVLAMIDKAKSAVELGEWLNAPRVLSVIDTMPESERAIVANAQKNKLESFEKEAA